MDAIQEQPTKVKAVAPYEYRWIALAAIIIGETLDLLDALVTNIAAPSIRAALGGGTSLIQWLGSGYTLAMAVALITGGPLGDMIGRRRMFIIGLAGFIVFSGLCAVAQSPEMLLAARVGQGGFGAMMLPQSFGLIREMFSPKEMVAALGAIGPVMALSTVGGPILAGVLIGADVFGSGWRMIFLINIPFGLIGLALAIKYLPKDQVRTKARMDYAGAALTALAGALIIYPLVQGREQDWPVWIFVLLGAAAVTVWALWVYEVRLEKRGGFPLIAPSLFKNRRFPAGLVTALSYFAAFVAFSLVFTLFVQYGLGYSAARAGVANMAPALAAVVGFGIVSSGTLAQRHGRAIIQFGAALAAVGSVITYLTMDGTGADVTLWKLTPGLVVTGLGMGLFMAPFFDIVMAGVEKEALGSAGGTITAFQQMGSSLGIAVIGTIFFASLPGQLTNGVEKTAPALERQLAAAAVPAATQSEIVKGINACVRATADADDPSVPPPACVSLRQEASAAAEASSRPEAVSVAFGSATKLVQKSGFGDVFEITLLVIAGLFLVTGLACSLLPPRARDPEDV